MSLRRLLALAGMLAPPLYFFTVLIVGILRSDYNFVTKVISDLTEPGTPYQDELTALFTLYDTLSVLFALRLAQWVSDHPTWRSLGFSGAAMAALVSVAGAIRVGFFPMDPLGAPPTPVGLAHLALAGLSSVSAVTTQMILGYWYDHLGLPGSFGRYSRLSGWVLFAGIVLTGVAVLLRLDWMGLVEKLSVIVYLQWMFVTALKLYS